MKLLDIIEITQKNRERIIEEHKILVEFQKKHPWHVLEVLEKMTEEGNPNVPTFDEAITLKEFYILDDLSGIYNQIKAMNPFFKKGTCNIFFYSIKEGLYKSQIKKGFSVGDRDSKGKLVTGCNLVLEIAEIDTLEFLNSYYCQYN
jgi:hypothetical protein